MTPALIAGCVLECDFRLAQKLLPQSRQRFSIFQIDPNNTTYSSHECQ
jgi:hypothetical protein